MCASVHTRGVCFFFPIGIASRRTSRLPNAAARPCPASAANESPQTNTTVNRIMVNESSLSSDTMHRLVPLTHHEVGQFLLSIDGSNISPSRLQSLRGMRGLILGWSSQPILLPARGAKRKYPPATASYPEVAGAHRSVPPPSQPGELGAHTQK